MPTTSMHEQLGAPTLLYRHKPSYAFDESTSSHIINDRKNEAIASSKPESNQNAYASVDTDSQYPPQPWGRLAPNDTLLTPTTAIPRVQFNKDCDYIRNLWNGGSRARVRTYFRDSLGYQKWDVRWWRRKERMYQKYLRAEIRDAGRKKRRKVDITVKGDDDHRDNGEDFGAMDENATTDIDMMNVENRQSAACTATTDSAVASMVKNTNNSSLGLPATNREDEEKAVTNIDNVITIDEIDTKEKETQQQNQPSQGEIQNIHTQSRIEIVTDEAAKGTKNGSTSSTNHNAEIFSEEKHRSNLVGSTVTMNSPGSRYSTPSSSSSSSSSDDSDDSGEVLLNHIPIDSRYYKRFRDSHDRIPYTLHEVQYSTPGLQPQEYFPGKHLISFQFRIDRMHSSPLQGYTAPFFCSAIRYGLGDSKKRRIYSTGNVDPYWLRERNITKKEQQRLRYLRALAENTGDSEKPDEIQSDNNAHDEEGDDDERSLTKEEEEIPSNMEKQSNDDSNGSKQSNLDSDDSNISSSEDEDDGKIPRTLPTNYRSTRSKTGNEWKTRTLPYDSIPKSQITGDHPSDYGNCLQLLPCVCSVCSRSSQAITPTKLEGDSTKKEDESSEIQRSSSSSSSSNSETSSSSSNSDSESDDRSTSSSNNSTSDGSSTGTNVSRPSSSFSSGNDASTEDSTNKMKKEEEIERKKEYSRNWFILHPTGNSVSVSSIIMPYGTDSVRDTEAAKKKDLSMKVYNPFSTHVEVGGKVLQLSACFDVDHSLAQNDKKFRNVSEHRSHKWWFVARTPTHCSLLTCTSKDWIKHGKKEDRLSRLAIEKASKSNEELCSGVYELKERLRIDLRNSKEGSFTPIHLATNPDTLDSNIVKPFAILSRENTNSFFHEKGTNTVHHGWLTESSPAIQKHTISKVSSISTVEFSRMHPMVLWSAARGPPPSTFYIGDIINPRPTLGYGHSLYSIDLRCDQAAFTWSPSHAEFMMDRIHSVSGILPDRYQPQTVYLSSLSAGGKMWKIDCRMPARAICSWTLPGLAEDYSGLISCAGVYGFGTIMTRPLKGICDPTNRFNSTGDLHSLPLLNLSKNPNSFGIHLYQDPINMPRFQTRNLERPPVAAKDVPVSSSNFNSIATSYALKLPDVSDGVFTCGLAAFYTNASAVLPCESLDSIGYNETPTRSLCVVSATSRGDLYTHTLLECDGNQQRKATTFEGLPVGTCAVPVPDNYQPKSPGYKTYSEEYNELRWILNNTFPIPGHSLLKHHVSSRTNCRPFETVQLRHLPCYSGGRKPETTRYVNHPAPACSKSFPLKLPSCHFVDKQNDIATRDRNVSNREEENVVELEYEDRTTLRADLSSGEIDLLNELWHENDRKA